MRQFAGLLLVFPFVLVFYIWLGGHDFRWERSEGNAFLFLFTALIWGYGAFVYFVTRGRK